MGKSLQTWKDQVYNRTLDFDNQSYDCVDVSKSWIMYLTDQPWQTVAGWGNAKDIYYNWVTTYLEKVPRGNAPKLGDIVVMNGTIGGGYGHTGVIVGIDGNNITIYQQNTFTQQPVYTGVYNAYVSYITGFLRPKVPFAIGAQVELLPYQRVAAYAAKYRDAPNTAGAILQTFVADDVYDFKGYVHGESVDGNDVWFVGRHTGGYAWSGAFKDTGTHDLHDLTPVKLESYQRIVGNSVINYRKLPEINPDNVIKTFQPSEILDFDAWTHGTYVDGSDVWFRGRHTGGWSHSGGFTNQTTTGLIEVKLEVVPIPVPPPATDNSKRVIDISSHNKVTDYVALRSAVRGVVAKAGHTGKSHGGLQPLNSDQSFSTNKNALGEKLVGAYWYGYPSLDPETEANAFVATVGAVPISFTYWLDIEEGDGQTDKQVNDWCVRFMNRVDELTNKVTGLYMNYNWYNNVIVPDTKSTRPIWLAHYGMSENTSIVTNQVAHQYTDKGSVNGIAGYVDMNVVTDAFFVPTMIVPPSEPVDPEDPTPVDPTPIPDTPKPPSHGTGLGTLLRKIGQIINKILSNFKRKK